MQGALRLGLIGAGRWGRNYIKTIAGLEGMRLACLASGNPESRTLVPSGCVVSPDWRAILDPRSIDALIVATPPALHAGMVEAAVAQAIPVLVEKPLTLDAGQAVALRDLVAARGGLVMVDHIHLFNPAYRALKAAAPRYGAIQAIDGHAGNHGPFRTHTEPLWDWGAHDVAMCLDLLGALPETLDAACLEARDTPEGSGQSLEVRASFAGPVSTVLRFGNIVSRVRRLAVYLERAVLVFDDLAEHQLVAYPPCAPHAPVVGAGERLPYERQSPLACVLREFAAAVAAGDRSTASLELGVEVVQVLARCEARLAVA